MALAVQKDATAYARMLRKLLPPGRLWRVDLSSYLMLLLLAAGDELTRVGGRALDIIEESDPRTATELLDEFESALAVDEAGTTAERRARITAKLTQLLGFRPADIQETLASLLGQDPANVVVIERDYTEPAVVAYATEIYRFFVYRDPLLAGTYYVDAAQTLLDDMSHSHTQGHVIESLAVLTDDPYSLTDRDPLGHDAETVLLTTPGTYEQAVLGATSYLAIGGGGGTGDASAASSGGGGGACSQYSDTYASTELVSIVVGAGGDDTGGTGGDSSVTDDSGLVCLAKAGTGGAAASAGSGGSSASGVGDTKFSGGGGGADDTGAGGGGGGAAGSSANGTAGGAAAAGVPGGGGAGNAPGAAGGDGGSSGNPGVAGNSPGGGAGGEGSLNTGGAAGGAGYVSVDLPQRPYKYEELL